MRQRILITLGINVITEHTCRTPIEGECNVKISSYSYYPKIAMSTVKDAAEYRISWNFLGAFKPCKSSTKITVCPSVYPSARGKIADPLKEFS